MKKALYFGLVFALIATNTPFFTNHININNQSLYTISHAMENSPNITSKNIRSTDELIEINLKIPIINGMDNLEIQKKLNSIFERDIISFKNEIEEISKEYADEADKLGIPKVPHSAFTDYTVCYNKNNLLSLYITYYQYTEGAHGLSIRKAYNINTKTCNLLSLKELLKSTSSYNSIIDKEIQAQIDKDKYIYFPDAFKGIVENQDFYLQNNYLVIFFQHYEIAPYAAGIPEFKIHLDKFKHFNTSL